MRIIEIKAYKFDELSDDAKQTAVQELSGINVDYEWWDSIYDDAENIGLKLTSFELDRNRHATGEFMLAANEVAQNIINDHGNMCETHKTALSFMDEWQPVFDEYMEKEDLELEEKLTEIESEFLKSLLEDYSIMLQKDYEYLMSDEAIIDTIHINEYEFDENGNMI